MPIFWAATQNSLGDALRALGERKDNTARLEEALAACRAALEELTRERVPVLRAPTHSSLGDALRALGEREKRLPFDWASTHKSLALCLELLESRTPQTNE